MYLTTPSTQSHLGPRRVLGSNCTGRLGWINLSLSICPLLLVRPKQSSLSWLVKKKIKNCRSEPVRISKSISKNQFVKAEIRKKKKKKTPSQAFPEASRLNRCTIKLKHPDDHLSNSRTSKDRSRPACRGLWVQKQTDTDRQAGPWKDLEGMHGRDGTLGHPEFRNLP